MQQNKNMESTLDMFLTGQVVEEAEKIVVEVNQPIQQIQTIQQPTKKKDDL